ncbi:CLCN3 [Cordylochernes scorpioides]|uniref:CLCN3 n=1 Tax=Cordylochernes scorpioides TaxID=51811 RepID=A0ABY6LDL1_9ARAC|nr:CLCN3 [Cordylochernes scorpioides]
MLEEIYSDHALSKSQCYRWFKKYQSGDFELDNEPHGKPPQKFEDAELQALLDEDSTQMQEKLAKQLQVSQASHEHSYEMLDSVRDDPNLLQRVITGDEAWVYGYDVETKAQSSQWKLPHEPRPKKARQVRSNVKVLLTVFFDCRGVVHHEFLPQGRTVNKEYYLQVMRNLREAIRQKRPDLWKNKNWLLHHDNAPAHTSLLVRDFLAKNNTLMMPQPPYSPDLALCDFFLFLN